MSCAGCDDCPQNAWHLHVTVNPPPKFVPGMPWLERLGYKTVIVTNMLQDGSSYEELIPTLHSRGTEMEAVRQLFRMGAQLEKAGFDVKRLKIEGNASTVLRGRVLYYEAHLKNLLPEAEARAKNLRVPLTLSINARGERIYTIRHPAFGYVHELAWSLSRAEDHPERTPRVGACVLDTAPELDDPWMRGTKHA